MAVSLYDFVATVSIANKVDLQPLHTFLPLGLQILKSLTDQERERRKERDELHDCDNEVGLTNDEVRRGWAFRLLQQMPSAEFRSNILLFNLHQQEIRNNLEAAGQETMLFCAMRDAAHAALFDAEFRANVAGSLVFSPADRAVFACSVIAQLVTERRRRYDDYAYRWSRITLDFDHPDATDLIHALCRQIADNRIWIRPDGIFSPTVVPAALPKQLLPCPYNIRGLKSVLVGAMARDWISVEDAERICLLDPLCDPWALLARTDEELGDTSATLTCFVQRLRQRFPAILDRLLFGTSDTPSQKRAMELTDLAANGTPEMWDDWVQLQFSREVGLDQGIDFHSFPWYVPRLAPESSAPSLYGSTGLLAAVRWVEKYGKLKKFDNSHPDYTDLLVKQLTFIRGLSANENPDEIIASLQECSRSILLMLLPWSGAAQSLVLRAARLDGLELLRQWMIQQAKIDTSDAHSAGENMLANHPDPRVGVVDVASLKLALSGVAAKDSKTLASAYAKAGMMPGIDKALAAFLGETDRTQLFDAAMEKLQQPAMKLLGLLPVVDAHDVRQRYLTLRKLYKEASKHGAQRQATQRAAAQAGLANLAQVAGYRDSGELEWVMETNEGPAVLASTSLRQIGEYQAAIELDGFTAELVFRNPDGKALKSAPAALKREPALAGLKVTLAEIREQFRRFARLMEMRMINTDSIGADQLRAAMDHPVMSPIVRGLIWQDEDGAIGLFCTDGLEGPDGIQPVTGTRLRLVHPVWLLRQDGGAGLLARWQRWLVAHQRMQPFKQAFREIYVLTPAEQEAGDRSSRYAGRQIQAGIAQGLFQARGWIVHADDARWSHSFGDGLMVSCDYSAGRYFGEEAEGEIQDLVFERNGKSLSLIDVPPTSFSEAMRDLDLVVTIAIPDGSDENHERFTSAASIAARTDLLRAMAPSLGERRLEFHERYVLVHGKLADYRIHLASGHVYIEPGAYLCIIPASLHDHSRVRLPFAEQDNKTAEIVSKVMLLAHDDEIKDASILRQIPATSV